VNSIDEMELTGKYKATPILYTRKPKEAPEKRSYYKSVYEDKNNQFESVL
jgi:hypothetical protein